MISPFFKWQTLQKFNPQLLEYKNFPISCFDFFLNHENIRVNHFCVKKPYSSYYSGNLSLQINALIYKTLIFLKENSIDTNSYYCYITIDSKDVNFGSTQRDDGWHIDGMQGDEISNKTMSDITFTISNNLPTLFVKQKFNINGFNSSKHNLFKWVSRQINEENIIQSQTHKVYLMNAYCVHKAMVNLKQKQSRFFVRISFTKTPITSKKMTINPLMTYDYPIHTTSGNIPDYLK